MKRLIAFLLLVSLALGADLAFGEGEIAGHVVDTLAGARDWILRGGERIADTAIGFDGNKPLR